MAEHVDRPLAEGRAKVREEARAAVAKAREEARAEVRAEAAKARAEALSQQRALLSRQAARRFGDEAGRAVAEALADAEDPAALERIGDLVVDCPTGERLLDALADVG